MIVESLHDRRRDDRIAAHVAPEGNQIVNRFFAADAVGRSFKRKIDRKLLQEIERRGALV